MKKIFFTLMLAGVATMGYAQETTYNYFDPADCDENGWLWLDTQEKIDKYCGPDKKIMLIECPFETEDPDFPGEFIKRQTVASADLKGYNTEGVQGGEGSKTGGIIMPGVLEEHDFFDNGPGGGILLHLPDCAQFDVYLSCEAPNIYTYLQGNKTGYVKSGECEYIWNEDDPWWLDPDNGPLTTNHVIEYLGVHEKFYDKSGNGGEGPDADILSFAGALGENRTAYISNYSYGELYLHGIRVKTYTDHSMLVSGVENVAADVDVKINGKVVYAPAAGEIAVYSVNGVKVASVYADSLDCSDLSGLYIVKAGNKAVKAVF